MIADRLSGILLFFFGLYVTYEASQLPLGRLHEPDSGFFPFILALSLLCASGFVLIGAFKGGCMRERVQFGEGTGRVLLAVAALVVYVVVLNGLGYLLSTFLIMILLLGGLERVGWRTTLWLALATVVISYFTFRWLGVPLPPGIIPL